MGLGASYLSRPVETKISEDKSNKKLSFGVSSMQGWRKTQEDAHNCILDFDDDTSLFAVYDGHGGSEVAVYTSDEFPKFLRNTDTYRNSLLKEALIEAFLGFDDTIVTSDVLNRLKQLAKADQDDKSSATEEDSDMQYLRSTIAESSRGGCSSSGGDDIDEEYEAPELLRRDALRPLEEVMASYCMTKMSKSISAEKGLKSASPFLRGRRDVVGQSGESSSGSVKEDCSGSADTFIASSGSSSSVTGTGDDNNLKAKLTDDSKTLNGDVTESISDLGKNIDVEIKSEDDQNSIKYSKPESVPNGPNSESLTNGTVSPVNGDINKDIHPETPTKRIVKESESISDQPSTSPKKKKLALTDLEDSTVVKNFITNDEIAEDDEEDSEDETFQVSKEDSPSDDDDGDEDESEDFTLSKKSLALHLLKNFQRKSLMYADDDDDDEDDEDYDEDGGSESKSSELNGGEEDADEEENEDEKEDEEEDEESEVEEDDEAELDFFNSSEQPGFDSGCTAVVALIKGDNLYVANAGDSRCVVSKNGDAIDMSEDHKPEDPIELERITKAGGKVTTDGRVNGGLNLSRAIGDHRYKENKSLPNTDQMITALPDVKVIKLEPDVEFIVLACDGIWNSMSSQAVVDFVRPKIQSNQKLSTICEELFSACLAPNTLGDGTGCDNMTCIIVKCNIDQSICGQVDSKVNVDQILCDAVSTISSDDNVTSSTDGNVAVASNVEETKGTSSIDENVEAAVAKDFNEKVQDQNTCQNDNIFCTDETTSKGSKRDAESIETDEVAIKKQKTEELDLNSSSSGETVVENL